MTDPNAPFHVVIPARYASSRLPGKVLADIGGTPMVVRVYERAIASGAESVTVATDDERVVDALAAHHITATMTAPEHRSGTERIAEVIKRNALAPDAVVVNVQADEPLIPRTLIAQVANNLATRPEFDVATLCEPIATQEALFDPNAVKVVMDAKGRALYFSRATLPWYRDEFAAGDRQPKALHHRHIGMYAYRAAFLLRYVELPECALEVAERLEQLRVLEHGGAIHVEVAAVDPGPGIDTEADLLAVRAQVAGTQEDVTQEDATQEDATQEDAT